jgi:hypothetical protein
MSNIRIVTEIKNRIDPTQKMIVQNMAGEAKIA